MMRKKKRRKTKESSRIWSQHDLPKEKELKVPRKIVLEPKENRKLG